MSELKTHDVTAIVVKNIQDLRTVAARYGFPMNDGQGRPPMFDIAAHVFAESGRVLDFSNYGANKPAAARKGNITYTIRALVNGEQREVVTTTAKVREFAGKVGTRGATSRNSYLEYAAAAWNVPAEELENVTLTESISAPRAASVPTVVEDTAVDAETASKPVAVAPKRKSRAKASKAVSEDVSDADAPVDLDSAAE